MDMAVDAPIGVTPVPRDGDLDWSQYPHDEYWPADPVLDPSWSFWDYYVAGNGTVCTGYSKLVEYHTASYARVHPFVYARQMQRIYNQHCRRFMVDPEARNRKEGQRCHGPAWSARNIYEWPLQQAVPFAVRSSINKTYAKVFECMQQGQIFLSNGGTDLKALDAFNKTVKQYAALQAQFAGDRATTSAGLLGLG